LRAIVQQSSVAFCRRPAPCCVLTLRTITDRRPEALILRQCADLSCAEIGGQLGVSEGAVKAILFRAREEFRKRCARQAARG